MDEKGARCTRRERGGREGSEVDEKGARDIHEK